MLACLVLLWALTLQAQDPDSLSPSSPAALSIPDTLSGPGPLFLPGPSLEYWMQDSLWGQTDVEMLRDTLPQKLPSTALSDSMLWSYLYLEDSLWVS